MSPSPIGVILEIIILRAYLFDENIKILTEYLLNIHL